MFSTPRKKRQPGRRGCKSFQTGSRVRRLLHEPLEDRTLLTGVSLLESTFFGGAGDQRGTDVEVQGSDIYVSVNGNETQSPSATSFLVKYSAPTGPSTTPVFSRSWTLGSLNGIAVKGGNVYGAGFSHPGDGLTSDGTGGTEVKSLLTSFDANNVSGAGPGGSNWAAVVPQGTFNTSPGTSFFLYNGVENYLDAIAVDNGGSTFVYAIGHAQPCSHTTFVVSKSDAAGNVLTAATAASVNFNTCSAPNSAKGAPFGIVEIGGSIYVSGNNHDNGNISRPTVWKYDANLSVQWKNQDTGIEGDFGGLATDGTSIYAVGQTRGADTDYIIAKYDQAGNQLWRTVSDGGGTGDFLRDVVTVGGRVFAVGYTNAPGAGSDDMVILEIDPSTGAVLSTDTYGGSQNDRANRVTSDGTDLYVIGESRSFAEGGNFVGQNDAVLLRYSTGVAPSVNTAPDVVLPTGNSALTFDGSDPSDQVAVGTPLPLAGQSFSWEFRVNRTANLSSLDSNIIFNDDPATFAGNGNHLHVGYRSPADGSGDFTFAFFNNDLNFSEPGGPGADIGAFVHWAGTYDASTGARTIYKNGVLVAQDNAGINAYGGPGNLIVGMDFHGDVDFVRIWDGLRTPAQIADSAAGQQPTDYSTALLAYEFNVTSGVVATDSSPHNNDGAITGATRTVLTAVADTTNEDVPLTINGVTVSDIDAGTDPIAMTLSVNNGSLALTDTTGLTFSDSDGSDGTLAFTGSQTDVTAAFAASIVYIPDQDFNGSDTLTITANDQGSTGSGGPQQDSEQLPIAVNPVSDVEFTQAAYQDGEGAGGSTVVTLTRDDTGTTCEVLVSIAGGTAIAGTDYDDSLFPLTVSFGSSEATKTITIPLTQDNVVELDETIDLQLAAIANATIGTQANAGLTIINDDTATFTIDDQSVDEAAGTMTLAVSLSNPVDIPITVDVGYTDATAGGLGVDYDSASDQVTFPAGSTTPQQVTVAITNDLLVEGNESFTAGLSTPTALGGRSVDLSDTGTVTIDDDDTASLSIAAADTVTEQGGTQTTDVTLTLGGTGTGPAALAVALTADVVDAGGGSALPTIDYTSAVGLTTNILDDNGDWTVTANNGGTTTGWTTGTVAGITPTAGTQAMHFNSGYSNQSGTAFIVFPDLLTEGLYTVSLDVGNYDGTPFATLGDIGMTAGGSQPTTEGSLLVPTSSSTPIPALGAVETFVYTYDIPAGHPQLGSNIGFVINVPRVGGSANVAFDNLRIETPLGAQQVSFPIGAGDGATDTVDVTPLNDLLVEGDETINLALQNLSSTVSGQASLGNTAGVVTIVDNDTASLIIDNVSLVEGDAPGSTDFIFTVSIDPAGGGTTAAEEITVVANTSGLTATGGGVDFADVVNRTLTIDAGTTSTTVTVDVTRENLAEIDETFEVNLIDARFHGATDPALVVIGDGTGIGTIQDDDFAPVANAGGPYVIDEGDPLTLNASTSTDADDGPAGLTFRWDVDGDGDYDEGVSGVNPTLSLAQLQALGLADGPHINTVTVEASDGTNTDTASTTLTVKNVAPNFEAGPNETLPAGSGAFSRADIAFTDPGTLDVHVVTIDYDGDSIIDQTINVPPGDRTFDLGHTYTASGTYTVSVTVGDDDAGTLIDSFDVTVVLNTPPTTSGIADVDLLEDAADTVVDLFAAFDDAEDPDTALTYTIESNTNTGLFTSANIAAGILTLDYLPDANGTADFTVRATDTGGLFVETTFTVSVTAVNDEPSFTMLGDQTVTEDSGTHTIAGFATAAPGGGPDEASQTFTYNVTNDNPTLFADGPAIDANGQLTFTPAADASGTAIVEVSVTDSGGTGNGGDDTSPLQTFQIEVLSAEQQTEQLGDDVQALEDAGDLNEGQANPVLNFLDQALKDLDKGKIDQAVKKLNDFVDRIHDLIDDGTLTSEEGQPLIEIATAAIQSALPGSPLMAASAAPSHVPVDRLTASQLDLAVRRASNYWYANGASRAGMARLSEIPIYVANLPGLYLGAASADAVWIDQDASGHGWFVDHRSPGGMDLLSAVTHEFGHVLGFEHDEGSVMQATLEVAFSQDAVVFYGESLPSVFFSNTAAAIDPRTFGVERRHGHDAVVRLAISDEAVRSVASEWSFATSDNTSISPRRLSVGGEAAVLEDEAEPTVDSESLVAENVDSVFGTF